MLRLGSHISGRSVPGPLILAMLCVIALLIYIFQKKKSTTVSSFSSNNIYLFLKKYGLSEELSKYATAQAAFETAGFTSRIFKENNNAFGMKWAGQAIPIGEKNEYANYDSVEASCADFVSWWNKTRRNIFNLTLYTGSLSYYVRYLKINNYFTAPESNYLAGVISWYKKYFNG